MARRLEIADTAGAASAASAETRRWPTIVAAGVGGLVVTVVVLSVLVWIARGMVSMPVSFGSTPLGVLGLVISPICYAAIGGILAARLPANPIGWLLLAMGAALGIMLPVNLLVSAAHESLQPASSMVIWLAWFRTAFGTPIVLATVVLAVQLFPDGRPLPGWWISGVWASIGAGLLLVATTAVDPIGSITYPSIPNPLALPYELRHVVGWARSAGVLVIIGAAGIAVGALWHRYRRGDAICRAQLRWIVWAAAFTVIGGVPFVIARYMLRVTDSTGELLAAIAQIGSCTFPLAAAFAISRYRLFDVDVVIGRTLVYLPMMAVLGGIYSAGIALFQRIFVAVTGSESDAAIVMTILVVATVFTPLRKGLEAIVDRRFSGSLADRVRAAELQAHGEPRRTAESGAASPAASPALTRAVGRVHVGALDDDGSVDCPRQSGVKIQDCLRCPYLEAFGDGAELTVVCRPPASG